MDHAVAHDFDLSTTTSHTKQPSSSPQILQKNDKTKIFLPPVVNPFAPPEADPGRPKESTYVDHELDQVTQLVRSTLIGLAITSFLHWKMGTKPVLVRTHNGRACGRRRGSCMLDNWYLTSLIIRVTPIIHS